MKGFLYILLSFLMVSSGGCHKKEEGPTSASGRVVDQATGQAVGGGRVRLLRSGGGGNVLSGGGTVPIDTVTADGSGHYSLSFSAAEGYTYEVQGYAPGYLTGSLDSQPLVRLTGGRKNKKDLPLRPEGYLRVRFLAPAPVPYSGASLNTYNGLPVTMRADIRGSAIDSTVIIVYPGGQSHQLIWSVQPDGTSTSYGQTATVYFPARDTADFTIRF